MLIENILHQIWSLSIMLETCHKSKEMILYQLIVVMRKENWKANIYRHQANAPERKESKKGNFT